MWLREEGEFGVFFQKQEVQRWEEERGVMEGEREKGVVNMGVG
jgi:hypothetical protein